MVTSYLEWSPSEEATCWKNALHKVPELGEGGMLRALNPSTVLQ